jgi:FkbM family methyltransferase
MRSARILVLGFKRRLRANVAKHGKRIVRWLAVRALPRRGLNFMYRTLSLELKGAFYARFAKLFRDYDGYFEPGEWKVTFRGKSIRFPLEKESLWLDWDVALSVLGHDQEIKHTYETLLRLTAPPRVVLDIGANYGTHSIIFLMSGIETVSFEPNPNCHPYIERLCVLNGQRCRIEPFAVGNKTDVSIELWFPQSEEWFGTTDIGAKKSLEARTEITRLLCPQTTIDKYLEINSIWPQLIKIDTEGNELKVLQGSIRTLSSLRPIVIFESWNDSDRNEIAALLAAYLYDICSIPIVADLAPRVLVATDFYKSSSCNFIAVPDEIVKTWPPNFTQSAKVVSVDVSTMT